jgi:hypothetical protein
MDHSLTKFGKGLRSARNQPSATRPLNKTEPPSGIKCSSRASSAWSPACC